MSTTQTTRNSLPSLWEQAVQLWRDLVLGFGHPHDLIRWGWMRALYHRALGHELRDLERLVRRAIRADARELDLPPLKPRAKRPPRRQDNPQSHEDMPRFRRSYSDDCTTWKVSFRMSAPAPGKHRGERKRKPRADYDPDQKRPCRNYAFRIEALRRAINDRDDYVRRYARRLARLEAARIEAVCAPMRRYLEEKSRQAAASPEAAPPPPPRNAKHVEPG